MFDLCRSLFVFNDQFLGDVTPEVYDILSSPRASLSTPRWSYYLFKLEIIFAILVFLIEGKVLRRLLLRSSTKFVSI